VQSVSSSLHVFYDIDLSAQDQIQDEIARPTARRDPELACVIDAWLRLPAAVRAGVIAVIKATDRG
jgi:hypothetical protein